MRSRTWAIAGVAVTVAGAQAGHLLAYQLRFGAAAQTIQSTGVHAYFPTLVKTTLGAVALVVLTALLIVGAARVVARSRRVRASNSPSFVGLLAALFTLQLGLFVAQEVMEALIAGVPTDSAAHLLLWGMIGQLPVAVAGATVLMWLGVRLEEAVNALGSVVPVTRPVLLTAALALMTVRPREHALATVHATRSPFVKRGPPISFSFRPF